MNPVDDSADETEINIKPICKFYKNIYKRMRTWFGFTYPFWLSDMNNEEILKCILKLNIAPGMYGIFINVAIKIKKNNNRPTELLEQYKKDHPDPEKNIKRKKYYDTNIDRIRQYNQMYNLIRASRINIFKKNTS